MFHVQKDRGIPQIGHPVNSKHFEGRPIDHLMIGCSDCSTTEPDILGIKMNRIMSHKNLGNLVHLSDLSSISVYARMNGTVIVMLERSGSTKLAPRPRKFLMIEKM